MLYFDIIDISKDALMLIKQILQKSAIFVTIGIFLDKGFKSQPKVCNGCHDALMISINLNNIALLKVYLTIL